MCMKRKLLFYKPMYSQSSLGRVGGNNKYDTDCTIQGRKKARYSGAEN